VREVEQEVQQTLVLVLDVGGSMRGGIPGQRKLDFALELAAAHARSWLDRGDRVGLACMDDETIAWVAPGEGGAQLMRIYDALMATTEVVDASLTALDDNEVIDLVARYVRQQDGLDFAARTGERWDVPALIAHVRASGAGSSELPRATTSAGALLRRFCRTRGLLLPHRASPRSGDKAPGLVDALERAGARVRDPRSIVVVTDLDGLVRYESVRAAAGLMRRHGHSVTIAVPDAVAITRPAGDAPLEENLRTIYAHGERRRLAQARRELAPMGVRVMSIASVSSPAAEAGRARRRVA
jgi:uncharacterized protein (DUF58 family)